MQKANNHSEVGSAKFSNLKRLAYFAAVVEAGSFTGAATRLGITKAVISQQVARLEREFRTTLLTRTTRKVVPTDAGRTLHQRCILILKEAGDAFAELAELAAEPSGTLRLTAPLDYGISALVPVIAEFTRRYPQCKVDAVLSDQSLDMTSNQLELAIRVGWLTDLNVQARQIGSFRQMLVVAASWRRHVARLKEPQEVSALPFVANTALRDPTHWSFSRNAAEQQSIAVNPVISLDATLAVRETVRQGAGFSILPDFTVEDDLASGRLLHVLPQWELPSGGIFAVFPTARFRPAKVLAFVEMVQANERMV